MRWLWIALIVVTPGVACAEDAASRWRRIEAEAMKRGMQVAPEVPYLREPLRTPYADSIVVPDALPPLQGYRPWVPAPITNCAFGWRSVTCD